MISCEYGQLIQPRHQVPTCSDVACNEDTECKNRERVHQLAFGVGYEGISVTRCSRLDGIRVVVVGCPLLAERVNNLAVAGGGAVPFRAPQTRARQFIPAAGNDGTKVDVNSPYLPALRIRVLEQHKFKPMPQGELMDCSK